MKTLAIAFAALLLVRGAVHADSTSSNQLVLPATPASAAGSLSPQAIPALTLAPLSDTTTSDQGLATGSSSHFAQLAATARMPVSPAMVFALIALFVVGMRLMGLRQARTMAVHERHSHHGKAEMFRALHAERSSR